jgi:hypothetical protein
MQYDLQIFVQDYQSYHFVELIIEKNLMIELNDLYHENSNDHFLFVLKMNFLLIMIDTFDDYHHVFYWNNLLTKKTTPLFIKN